MRQLSEKERIQIQRYLTLEEKELYALIPPHLPEYDYTEFAPSGQAEAGRIFFQKIIKDLRKAVCEDFDWPSKRHDPEFNDTVNLIASIADVIATHVAGVPPFVIATLLVRKGLDNLCKSEIKGEH